MNNTTRRTLATLGIALSEVALDDNQGRAEDALIGRCMCLLAACLAKDWPLAKEALMGFENILNNTIAEPAEEQEAQ